MPYKDPAKNTECKKKYYLQNQERLQAVQRTYNAKRAAVNSIIIEAHKLLHPCSCGEARTHCLDLHHRDPSTKEYDIAAKASRMNPDVLRAEIDKCDVLCANCHRDLHHQIRQAGR